MIEYGILHVHAQYFQMFVEIEPFHEQNNVNTPLTVMMDRVV